MLVHSGIFSSIQCILRCLEKAWGGEYQFDRPCPMAIIVEEARHHVTSIRNLSGAEMASLMKLGTRVVRGPDWKWGDQVNRLVCNALVELKFFLSTENHPMVITKLLLKSSVKKKVNTPRTANFESWKTAEFLELTKTNRAKWKVSREYTFRNEVSYQILYV